MKFHVITLFAEMFGAPLGQSIIGRAQERRLIEIEFVNPRDFTTDRHRTVDAPPYGGGPGMVMMAQPLLDAVAKVNAGYSQESNPPVLLMSAQGERFTQSIAQELASSPALTIVCGHYEGIDERFIESAVDREISIGDYVLTGGEIPAMAVIDAVSRLLPGVLGDDSSAQLESFSPTNRGMLEGPVYTRPADLGGSRVPEELLSGDHEAVARFRHRMAAERTLARRPDLMEGWGAAVDADRDSE